MKKLWTFTFATLAFVTLTFNYASAEDDKKPQKSSDSKSDNCTYTKTAIGYAAIDCRGQTIIRGPFSQSCTQTGTCGSVTENTTQECANAALGAYIAYQIQQMIAACKDAP
jgi:hypothetical protein